VTSHVIDAETLEPKQFVPYVMAAVGDVSRQVQCFCSEVHRRVGSRQVALIGEALHHEIVEMFNTAVQMSMYSSVTYWQIQVRH